MFENKVAVITGAGGTLCSAIAIDLAKQGAKVVLVGRTKEKLDVVREKIEKDDANPEYIMTKWGVGYYFKDPAK